MSKVIILKGLPASGKSTYCNEKLADPAYKRVNKDAIRHMLAGDGYYDKPDEKLVHDLYLSNIKYCLEKGYNVLCDATQLAVKNETELRKIALGYDAEVEVVFFDTPVDECIKRDKERTGFAHVGEKVIRGFYNRYFKDKKFQVENPLKEEDLPTLTKYEVDPNLPWAIMFDLDGTLADMGTRNPFNWKACINDKPREAVTFLAKLVRDYEGQCDIIFMSGRDEVCRPETAAWIKRELNITPDHLYMRPEGDNRKDNIIKSELFDAHIRGRFNVHFVVDDRKQVVDMWRELGLDCFQVAPGDF